MGCIKESWEYAMSTLEDRPFLGNKDNVKTVFDCIRNLLYSVTVIALGKFLINKVGFNPWNAGIRPLHANFSYWNYFKKVWQLCYTWSMGYLLIGIGILLFFIAALNGLAIIGKCLKKKDSTKTIVWRRIFIVVFYGAIVLQLVIAEFYSLDSKQPKPQQTNITSQESH